MVTDKADKKLLAQDERAEILKNERLSADYFKLIVRSPHIARAALPGQFVLLRVDDDTDPLLRRPLGVYRIKGDEVHFLIQVVGKGTELLREKQHGGKVSVMGPLGHGFRTEGVGKRTIFVAGGIGIVPLVFLGERHPAERLFFGAKAKEHLISESEMGRIARNRDYATEDGSLGYRGLISERLESFLKTERKTSDCFIYACGPKGLVRRVKELAGEFGVNGEASLDERMACGLGACLGCAVETIDGTKMVCKDGPVFNLDELVF
ncbi:MAG: dihydroorotate dehydrogenase electron transfer subunit [Candidatus Omnitrophica bacterium]|nr:dihydroorotate dehydrogenase electron transfer subunit [Candidatus Omnitrophota bacterium]